HFKVLIKVLQANSFLLVFAPFVLLIYSYFLSVCVSHLCLSLSLSLSPSLSPSLPLSFSPLFPEELQRRPFSLLLSSSPSLLLSSLLLSSSPSLPSPSLSFSPLLPPLLSPSLS